MSCRRACPAAFRHFATIEQPTTPTDGETKPTWSSLATGVPCDRTHRTGREVNNNNQQVPLATEQVVLRWRGDLFPEMRFRFATTGTADEVLEIHDVGDVDGNRMFLTCLCNRLRST